MNAREKAEAGLRLLKDATLEYLATRPEGVPVAEAREALGLETTDLKGGHRGMLFWGLHDLLIKEGKAEIREQNGHNLLFLVA
jgi:hypothetical protein